MNVNLGDRITHPLFADIKRIARSQGVEAYVVGGFVRDSLMGMTSGDVDIVTTGNGIELAKALAELGGKKRKVTIYKKFGTAMVNFGEIKVEFVGARKESYRSTSRKPEVSEGTLEDDRMRRDFTVNAMSISLNERDYGNLVDPFNGLEDLLKKTIRTPRDPDITFSDDPLRMMRALRFAAQLEFAIHPETQEAIRANRERISIVSQERITEELNKIILSDKPSLGLEPMFDTQLLHLVFPELARLQGVEVMNGQAHKDNFYHTLQVLDAVALKSDDLWLRWAAILHDIAKPLTKRFDPVNGWTFHGHEDRGARMVEKIFRKLKLPLDNKMKFVSKIVRLHLRPIALTTDKVSDSGLRRLLFEAGDDLESLMTLCKADITSKNEKKVARYLNNFELVSEKLRCVEEKDRLRNWQPPVSGELIMKTFNINPCREVGIIKNEIREAILDGAIGNNFEDAFQLMLEAGKKLGLTEVKDNM